jgi:SEFIR domain
MRETHGVTQTESGPITAPRVFVTYSHDTAEHVNLVLRFCTLLRRDAGIDVHMDQWDDDGPRDWSAWAALQIRQADFIVAIASPAYKRRAEGLVPADEGRGSQYEAALLRDNLTRNFAEETRRILPVVLPGRSINEIPDFMRPFSSTRYAVDRLDLEGVAHVIAALSRAAQHPRPERGHFAGNPYADLHARLQAGEHSGERMQRDQENPPTPTVNHGFAIFGPYEHHGDNVTGNKSVNHYGKEHP